jgi:hypothetical protein
MVTVVLLGRIGFGIGFGKYYRRAGLAIDK